MNKENANKFKHRKVKRHCTNETVRNSTWKWGRKAPEITAKDACTFPPRFSELCSQNRLVQNLQPLPSAFSI